MTTTERVWAERVAEWQSSGMTSEEYSRGRDFTAGGLRHWAYRLRKAAAKRGAAARKAARPTVRLARLVRAPAAPPPVATQQTPAVGLPAESAGLTLRVGQVQVAVSCGFDRPTLAAVLEVLGAGAGR
jgi:hypothetical protein